MRVLQSIAYCWHCGQCTGQCLGCLQEARALDLKRALMNQHDRTTAMQVLTATPSCLSWLNGHHAYVLDPLC